MAKKSQTVLTIKPGDGIDEGMTNSQVFAFLAGRAGMAATMIPRFIASAEGVDPADVWLELKKAAVEVNEGRLGRMEQVLVHQALALDVMFSDLALRARSQEFLSSMETLMRLALKCQAQSRASIEAIGHLKNPVPFIKQANIASGHQQVNNTYASASVHTYKTSKDSESTPNKLLEATDGTGMDTGAQAAAGPAHQDLEALGAVERAQDA